MKDAYAIVYCEVNVLGNQALFTTQQFDLSTVPTPLHSAVLPYGMGTVLSLTPIAANADGSPQLEPGDIFFCDGDCHTIETYLKKYVPN